MFAPMMHEFIKRCKRWPHLFPVFGHPFNHVEDSPGIVTFRSRSFSLYPVTFHGGVSPKAVTFGRCFPVFGHLASPDPVTLTTMYSRIQSPSYPYRVTFDRRKPCPAYVHEVP